MDSDRKDTFAALRRGLARTRAALSTDLGELIRGRDTLDARGAEQLEDLLLLADVGVTTTGHIMATLGGRGGDLYARLRATLIDMLAAHNRPLVVPANAGKPFVIMAVGVNGVGKTTTIAKLAARLQAEGHQVVLAAADTFRAAATEQLATWGERLGVRVIAQSQGADAGSVAHDGYQAACARGADVLIVDTAGRQHTDHNLMAELRKLRRVLHKLDDDAPGEVLMVLDAGTGQNALVQLKHFDAAVGVTGLCLTKLDGSARGGILLAVAHHSPVPIRYVGTGEGVDDLRPFDTEAFVAGLLPDEPAPDTS